MQGQGDMKATRGQDVAENRHKRDKPDNQEATLGRRTVVAFTATSREPEWLNGDDTAATKAATGMNSALNGGPEKDL